MKSTSRVCDESVRPRAWSAKHVQWQFRGVWNPIRVVSSERFILICLRTTSTVRRRESERHWQWSGYELWHAGRYSSCRWRSGGQLTLGKEKVWVSECWTRKSWLIDQNVKQEASNTGGRCNDKAEANMARDIAIRTAYQKEIFQVMKDHRSLSLRVELHLEVQQCRRSFKVQLKSIMSQTNLLRRSRSSSWELISRSCLSIFCFSWSHQCPAIWKLGCYSFEFEMVDECRSISRQGGLK
jgi:hypothetical protein